MEIVKIYLRSGAVVTLRAKRVRVNVDYISQAIKSWEIEEPDSGAEMLVYLNAEEAAAITSQTEQAVKGTED